MKNKLKNFAINSRIVFWCLTVIRYPFRSFSRCLKKAYPVPSRPASISVIIPNYNYSKYLRRRIASILNQTYPISELIILDDRSTDNSVEIINEEIAKIHQSHPGLRVVFSQNTKNSGKAMLAWQKGFGLATGDYIWVAEVDDDSDRNFLAAAMSGFKDEKVTISYTESIVRNAHGATICESYRKIADKAKTRHWDKDYINTGKREIEEVMYLNCTIPNVSGVVFKNSSKIPYQKYLTEVQKFKQVGDWYFYLHILNHGKIAYNKSSLNFFRLHLDSVTNQNNKSNNHYGEIAKIHQYILENYNVSEEKQKQMVLEEQRVRNRDIIK